MLWAKRLLVMIKDMFELGRYCFGRTHCRYAAELSPAVRRCQLDFLRLGGVTLFYADHHFRSSLPDWRLLARVRD
jgi:hypothetical protein